VENVPGPFAAVVLPLSRRKLIALAVLAELIAAYLAYIAMTGGSVRTHGVAHGGSAVTNPRTCPGVGTTSRGPRRGGAKFEGITLMTGPHPAVGCGAHKLPHSAGR
jgi:hypothetical protein